jgi:hypothetical protein
MYFTTSLLVFAGGLVVFGFFLEGVGMRKKLRAIRPSYYVIKCFANPVYDLSRNIAYLYTFAGRVLSNIRDVLDSIIQRLMPWLRPYFDMVKEGCVYVKWAVRDVFEALPQVIARGFTDAIARHRNLTALISPGLILGTGYFFYRYL